MMKGIALNSSKSLQLNLIIKANNVMMLQKHNHYIVNIQLHRSLYLILIISFENFEQYLRYYIIYE